ncbi:MAG: hypothetical protein L6R40_004844 [Gallowayella cf. fulva]|nr:MAG: hypothetical protein L6R40_004844 [Xanthomendoza cf. fulva]
MAQVSPLYPNYEPFSVPVSNDITITGVRNGDGPPLLLLHGFPQTHLMWHKVAPRTAPTLHPYNPRPARLRLLLQTLLPQPGRSHPLRQKPPWPSIASPSWNPWAIPKTNYICAHDRGARLAHQLCITHPHKVKKCILLDICPTKSMYAATQHTFAQVYWHWFFLTQPAPFPENVITAAPAAFAEKCLVRPGGAGRSMYDGMAYAAYAKQFEDWETVHAMCEDYRASAKEDIEEQTRDLEAGRKIRCPLRVLWGKAGVVDMLFDAKGEWRKVSGEGSLDEEGSCAVDCGHFILEEKPEEVVRHCLEFFR